MTPPTDKALVMTHGSLPLVLEFFCSFLYPHLQIFPGTYFHVLTSHFHCFV